MTKPINDQMIGCLVAELLENHRTACQESDTSSLSLEGHETANISDVDLIGGDEAHIRMMTTDGKAFRILVTQEG